MSGQGLIFQIYVTLRQEFGQQNWWPAETPFEVMVGAVLTQNTNWQNAEEAIKNLRGANLLDPTALAKTDLEKIQELIKPAGYYRQKAARLKRLTDWVMKRFVPGDTEFGAIQWEPADVLREELLAINGIGPETADSILLYALEKPVFVIDAYTVRILGRHGLITGEAAYQEVQEEFQYRLPPDVEIYKDFHAQLVELGKRFCKKSSPKCEECPVRPLLGLPEIEL